MVKPDYSNPTMYIAIGSGATWLYGKIRRRVRANVNQEIVNNFVTQVAENHLPHIYSALKDIAGGLGVKLSEPPPIEFTQLNGKEHK